MNQVTRIPIRELRTRLELEWLAFAEEDPFGIAGKSVDQVVTEALDELDELLDEEGNPDEG
jgi:hypothetical protein